MIPRLFLSSLVALSAMASTSVRALPAVPTRPAVTPILIKDASADRRRHRHLTPAYEYVGRQRTYPYGGDPSTGYRVNRQGFGSYRPGPDGSFGGYPAGSAGAEELQNNQRYQCLYTPETC